MNDFNIYDSSFLKEEVRDGYLVSEQMKRVWACELDLLRELTRVCNKYNLQYWADSGTLLGAVRHKGFIPWDDDIDIAMLREDYDKLVAVADKEFAEPYFFQTYYSDFYCIHRHGQLHNVQTAAIPHGYYKRKGTQGIFIDIFVLDAYPQSIWKAFKQVALIKHRQRLVRRASSLKKHFPFLFPQKYRWDIARFKMYEDTLRETKLADSQYVAFMSFNLAERIRDKDFYKETLYLDFENVKIPVPAGYDKILTTEYGDYMTPHQAPSMHGDMIHDTERSYKVVLEELRKKGMK